MVLNLSNVRNGYTIVELMVTIVIVSVLAATVGVLFVKLLTLQEQEREEAYVREKLVDICGTYADYLSIGSSISTLTNQVDRSVVVKYRQETGGVSLETGVVSHVTHLISSMNTDNKTLDLNTYALKFGELERNFSRSANGNASLIPLAGAIVDCTITPLNVGYLKSDEESRFAGFQTSDAALGYLQVSARYQIKNNHRGIEVRTASAGRIVRLWNHK